MSTLSGCTIVRNGVKNRYPLEASIRSYYPICDEVVVCYDPTSDDSTELLVRDLAARYPKIRLLPSVWDPNNRTGGSEMAIQSNVAIEACRSQWVLCVQADEAIHEHDHPKIREILVAEDVLGAVFDWRSFVQSLDREISIDRPPRLRLFRNGTCLSVLDSWTCAPVPGAKGRIVNAGLRMFNYCYVGGKDEILDRCRSRDALYMANEQVERNLREVRLDHGKDCDLGVHPAAIREWYLGNVTSAKSAGHVARVTLGLLLGNGERVNIAPFLWQFRGWQGDVVIVDDETVDGGAEVLLAHLSTVLGLSGDRVRMIRRSFSGDFGKARTWLNELSRTAWVLQADLDELWEPRLISSIERLITQLEADGKTVCGFPRANLLDGVLCNDSLPSEGRDEALDRTRMSQTWPPRNRDQQFRLVRRDTRWTSGIHSIPAPVLDPSSSAQCALIQDHWILHNKSFKRQRAQHRFYTSLGEKGRQAGGIAVVVMLAPGCEQALDRQWRALGNYRAEADIYASLDGVDVDLPEWVKPLRPPAGTLGIVRPTKACVQELAREARHEFLLRLTWDAELVMPLGFSKDPETVYGSLRWNPDERVRDHLRGLGLDPGRAERMYVDGFAMLASMDWWKNIYCTLPGSITHYCDDAVSCNVGENEGYELAHLPLALHRHFEWRLPAGEPIHA
jgi:hypothetical protein